MQAACMHVSALKPDSPLGFKGHQTAPMEARGQRHGGERAEWKVLKVILSPNTWKNHTHTHTQLENWSVPLIITPQEQSRGEEIDWLALWKKKKNLLKGFTPDSSEMDLLHIHACEMYRLWAHVTTGSYVANLIIRGHMHRVSISERWLGVFSFPLAHGRHRRVDDYVLTQPQPRQKENKEMEEEARFTPPWKGHQTMWVVSRLMMLFTFL